MLPRRDSVAPAQIDWSELDKKRYYFFGPTLFLCVRAAIYPSNLVKTRLQVRIRGWVDRPPLIHLIAYRPKEEQMQYTLGRLMRFVR